jgi:hypothetical protein
MLDDEMQERVHEAKQRVWDEMSQEERNYQYIMNDRRSPEVEKTQIESNDRGNLILMGYILAMLIFSIFF